MTPRPTIAQLGRRLRIGFVGGGLDSVIGQTHLIAARIDGMAEVVAGAMSIDPAVADASAAALLIAEDRRYGSWREMLAREVRREDRIDVVVVATPPGLHAEITIAYLGAGINVLCEKPMTATVEEAEAVEAAAVRADALFAITHCYTGYPMVREARQLVADGAIGRVTMVDGQFAAGDPGVLREPEDREAAHWHFKPSAMGHGVVLGEVGSHAHNIVEFVTGQRVTQVQAQMDVLAERREVFDNAYLNLRFDGGAVGRLWASYVAAGHEHGLGFRVYGTDGCLRWDQESPEYLWVTRAGGPAVRESRGLDSTSERSKRATRIRPGHPEGYLMAFANVYRDFLTAVLCKELGSSTADALQDLPSAADGVSTLRLIQAAVRSVEEQAPVALHPAGALR